MRKVIIADDEKKICSLIVQLVDWRALGFEVAGVAHDGLKAYELIQAQKPDLVISDIRMPSLTGLEMIGKLHEAGVKPHFILISGYREFEYAQNAMRFGVTDYLLKPINKEELTESLRRIAERLAERQEPPGAGDPAGAEHREDFITRQRLLSNLAQQYTSSKGMTHTLLREQYRYHFSEGPIGCFIVKADCDAPENLSMQPFILDKAAQTTRRIGLQLCEDFESVTIGSRLYCIFQAENSWSYLETLAEQLAQLTAQYEAYSLTIGTGGESEDPGRLDELLALANRAVAHRLLKGLNHIVDGPGLAAAAPPADAALGNAKRSALLNAIEVDNLQNVQLALKEIFAPWLRAGGEGPEPGLLYDTIWEVVAAVRVRYGGSGGGQDALDDPAALREAVDNATTVTKLVAGFCDAFLAWIEPLLEYRRTQAGRPVRVAVEYLEHHFGEAITLEDMAATAGVTASYFSTIFKKEMGANFSDYLTRLRMEEAKRLLRGSDWSVADIAERVGYSDYRYFSKVFTKAYGISPAKYRKL